MRPLCRCAAYEPEYVSHSAGCSSLSSNSAEVTGAIETGGAADALVAILGKLGDFRGESLFTTWARKFAVFEAGAKVRRRAWRGREILLEPGAWLLLADRAPTPQQHAETRELLEALREGIKSQLTARQREVLVAVAVNDVPIDVLAERLDTTRGAIYKTMHDARQKLRAVLAARGLSVDKHQGGRAGERT